MFDTFRKTFYLVGRENPARWVALIAGAVVASGLEMVGALLIYLLLALVVDPTGALEVPLLGDLRAYVGDVEQTTFLLWAALGIGAFFVLRAGYQIVYAYIKHRLAHNAGARLSSRLAEGYLALPYSYHLQHRSSELVRNAQQSVAELSQQCFLPVIIVIAESLVVLGLLTVMLLVAPIPTLIAIAVMGSAALLLLKTVQPRLRNLGAQAQEQRKATLASLSQALAGIRDIKVLGVGRAFAQIYRTAYDQLARAMYLRGPILDLPRLVIETALIIFILVLFSVSIAAGTATQELLSTLGLFAYAGLRIQPALQKLLGGLNAVRYSAQAVDDVATDLRLIEGLEPEPADVEPLPYTEVLHLDNVSFTYEGADRPAIRNVDLTIRRGEMIGIYGPTGGGKTTLVDLIIGLLDPTEGRVTVDGVDIAEHRDAWWRNLGVVPQMVFLIDDTLRRNIALGIPDDEVDETALARATAAAQLNGVIAELPDGTDTVIGERGVRLSGGQRQRVAIARALYRDTRVLVVDEGTSALDHVTEKAVMRALEDGAGDRTAILVAHRTDTLAGCNRTFYVVAEGVTQQDTPQRRPALSGDTPVDAKPKSTPRVEGSRSSGL